ncbi:MAG: hypothetical protein L0I85_07540 [Staphylococcus equorum]|nr:hypothetical protein [Staphylococcus equorum]
MKLLEKMVWKAYENISIIGLFSEDVYNNSILFEQASSKSLKPQQQPEVEEENLEFIDRYPTTAATLINAVSLYDKFTNGVSFSTSISDKVEIANPEHLECIVPDFA